MATRHAAVREANKGRNIASAALAVWLSTGSLANAGTEGTVRFQLTDLDLRDPHMFTVVFGCIDVTDSSLGISFNEALQGAIQTDGDGNGYLDEGYVIEFSSLDQSAPTNPVAFGNALCTAPFATSTCSGPSIPGSNPAAMDLEPACLLPLDGTVRPYNPAVVGPAPPCFVSSESDLTLGLAGLPMTLHDAQVGAMFVDDPATSLASGLIRGFVTETAANSTVFPAEYAVLGGQSLSSVLRGGTGNCASGSDMDLNGDQAGWWFYFNFVAQRVEASPDGFFADGFESLGD